jgi:hypothetical protein
MRIFPILLVLAGCAAPGPQGPSRDQEALGRELAGREARAPENCVPAERGRTLWVNRLEAECPGLRPLDTLVLEVQGSQYCRSDRFRTISAGSTIPGPTCLLGSFTPYRRR